MLVAFRFPSIVVGFSSFIHLTITHTDMWALGEADAELTWLSKEGFIDAIASEDSNLIALSTMVVLQK